MALANNRHIWYPNSRSIKNYLLFEFKRILNSESKRVKSFFPNGELLENVARKINLLSENKNILHMFNMLDNKYYEHQNSEISTTTLQDINRKITDL